MTDPTFAPGDPGPPTDRADGGATDLAERFDGLATDEARPMLHRCLEAEAWVELVLAGRPYGTTEALGAGLRGAAAAMDDAALASALAAHPRIGERPRGEGAAAAFSRSEQSGVDPADGTVQARLREGNLAYEEKFGHVFLIRAAGRSAAEILASLDERLTHDAATEREVTKEQLGEIALLRLRQQLEALATAPFPGFTEESGSTPPVVAPRGYGEPGRSG